MLTVALIRQRSTRLIRKFDDLRSTTGSPTRALFFLGKYILVKAGFLAVHMALAFRRKRVRAEVINAQPVSHLGETPPLLAIKLTGGIGDLIVIARYIRDLLNSSEQFRFDIYHKDASLVGWIFAGVPGFRSVYSEFLFDHLNHEYPLALWINQFVVFYAETANWAMLREHRKLITTLQHISKFRRNIEPAIAAHPYMDGYISQQAIYRNLRRADFLHGMSKIPYGGDALDISVSDRIVEDYGLRPRQYITIHNGFDPAFVITAKTATKCYLHFDRVIQLLKATYPTLKIVQIGVNTSVPIPGIDLNVIVKSSIRESAALLKYALMHVDNEGGLVHIARCFGVRSCVVFGPTPIDYFGYPDNVNLRPGTCGGCWWINQTWMDQCPRGFSEPVCMESHTPDAIVSAITKALGDQPSGEAALLNYAPPRQRRVRGV